MRIRRALGVAYLKTSGALDQMIEFTKHQQASIDVVDQQIHQTTPKPMTLEDKSFQQAAADQQQPVQTNQTPATAEPAKPAEHPAQTSPAEPAPPAQQPATPAQPATAAVAHAEDHSVAQTSGHHDFDIGNLVPTQVGGKGGRNTGAARYT